MHGLCEGKKQIGTPKLKSCLICNTKEFVAQKANFHKQNYTFQYTVRKLHKSFRLLLQTCIIIFILILIYIYNKKEFAAQEAYFHKQNYKFNFYKFICLI